MSAVKLLFIRAFISPPTEKSDGFQREQWMRVRGGEKAWVGGEGGWGGEGLIPLCIRPQPANLHLSAVAPALKRVPLQCCGTRISVGGGVSRTLWGRKWLKRC